MADVASLASRTTSDGKHTSPTSIPTVSSNVPHGPSFTLVKPPKLRGSLPRRVDSAVSISSICPPDFPEDTSSRTSFQAYAQSRMKLNMATRPHHKRKHAISSSTPFFSRGGESCKHHMRNYYSSPIPEEDLEEYNSIHLGPQIIVSSADGTSVRPEAHGNDEMKNMAAVTLYRAIEARQKLANQQTLDNHLEITIGAIDTEVQIKSVAARRRVHFVEVPEIQPQQAVFEGVNEDVAPQQAVFEAMNEDAALGNKGIIRRASKRMKGRVSAWLGKLV